MSHARATVLLAAALFAPAGCDDRPLLPRSRVVSPRIIAIVADPPEIRPGQRTVVSVVTGGLTMPPRFRWLVCARPEATPNFVAQSTFGVAEPEQGCFGDGAVDVYPLPGEGPSTLFAVPADLLTRLEVLRAVYGRNLPAETLRRIAQTVGLTVTIAVEMTHGGTTVRALKRVVVVDRPDTNTNPPPPSFRFGVGPDGGEGGIPVGRVAGDDELCARTNMGPLRVRTGQRVEIAPDATEDAWLESYDTLDSTGMLVRARETAYYSWFATAGDFAQDRTRIPIRNTVWIAPSQEGQVTHWLVARDGRGGTSVCRYVVDVQAR